MTYILRNPMMVPPPHSSAYSGFEYQQPETGAWLDGRSLDATVALVVKHRVANNLPRQSADESNQDVQTQICQRVGAGWCENDSEKRWNFPKGWDSVVAGSKTLAKLAATGLTGGNPYVPQSEAERRAAICAKCFANQTMAGCLSCGFFDLVRGLVKECGPDQQTPSDDKLSSCMVCQCLLVKKVHVSGDIIKSGMSDMQKAAYQEIPNCWCADL